ncbi:hypothetical protein BD410DRAFT_79151 [Rickenella mellea]|uniref:CNH-domain-containing protein n=1 Tax=Rickenella mellea TaxID=50990 RepID=A0A4Y7PND3_9AGAM|nr:hypothetical protein BD410DRAFT_79151 [Rickenella mellea]
MTRLAPYPPEMSPRVNPHLVPVSRSYTFGDSQDATAIHSCASPGSFPNPWPSRPQQLHHHQNVSDPGALYRSDSNHRLPGHRLGLPGDIQPEVHNTNDRIPARTNSNGSIHDRVTDHPSARIHHDDRTMAYGMSEGLNHSRRPSFSSPIFAMDDDSKDIINTSHFNGSTSVEQSGYLSIPNAHPNRISRRSSLDNAKGKDTCRFAEKITTSSSLTSGSNRAQPQVLPSRSFPHHSKHSQCDDEFPRAATPSKYRRELSNRRTSYELRQHSTSPTRQLPTANVSPTEPNTSIYSAFPASATQNIPASVRKSRSETHEQSSPARLGFQHVDVHPTSYSGWSTSRLVSNDEMRRSRFYQPVSRNRDGNREGESIFNSAMSRGELHQDGYDVAIDSRTQIRKFHSGVIIPSNPEWHELVSPIVQAGMSLKECERQGVLFEFIKGEISYVNSLTAFRDVYFEHLLGNRRTFHGHLPQCVWEFDKSLNCLLMHHDEMSSRLKFVQLEEHPIIRTIAYILLELFKDNDFCSAFMSCMETAPLVVDWHRKIKDHDAVYMSILDKCMKDARFKKREITAFFYLPKERICHLTVLLERMLKKTDGDHPDFTTLPILTNNVRELLENAQEGVTRSEKRLEMLSIISQLDLGSGKTASEYQLYDEDRQLLHIGNQIMCELPSYRFSDLQQSSWNECKIILLDNYFFICTRKRDSTGTERLRVKYIPISTAFLHLPFFPSVPVPRTNSPGTSRYEIVQMYPIRLCDGRSELSYTFYTESEAERKRWNEALRNAIRGCELRQDADWPIKTRVLNHSIPKSTKSKSREPRSITCAIPFTCGSQNYLAVGCESGIYIARKEGNDLNFKQVYQCNRQGPISIASLQAFDLLLVLIGHTLYSFSLGMALAVFRGERTSQDLKSTRTVVGGDRKAKVTCFVTGNLARSGGNEISIIYALENDGKGTVCAVSAVKPGRNSAGPFFIPRPAKDLKILSNGVITITTRSSFFVVETTRAFSSGESLPNFEGALGSVSLDDLKRRCNVAQPLGLLRSANDELMLIYDKFGVYVDSLGVPSRNCRTISWSTKPRSCRQAGRHVLLFSDNFVEIRSLSNGELVQLINGHSLWLVPSVVDGKSPVYASVHVVEEGDAGDESTTERLLELALTNTLGRTDPSHTFPPAHRQ